NCDQDKFILTMISISLPTRTDRHKSTRNKRNYKGNRMNQDNSDEVTLSIIEFISQLKCKKSHYARSDSGRSYLPPQWSVKYLWEQWNKKRILDNKLTSSRGKFHKFWPSTSILKNF
ncbi:Uncharacterized protein FWK35_00024345, partial [Aphis craccivora]